MIEMASFELVPVDLTQGENSVTLDDAAQRFLGEFNATYLKLIISAANHSNRSAIFHKATGSFPFPKADDTTGSPWWILANRTIEACSAHVYPMKDSQRTQLLREIQGRDPELCPQALDWFEGSVKKGMSATGPHYATSGQDNRFQYCNFSTREQEKLPFVWEPARVTRIVRGLVRH